MTPDALVTQILARSDQILWLWNFYAAAAAVLVAAALTSNTLRSDRRALRVALFGFAFSAYTHLECMRWVLKQWGVLAAALKRSEFYQRLAEADRAALDGVIDAPHPLWVVPFHLALDVFVLAVVWRSRRTPPSPPAAAGGLS